MFDEVIDTSIKPDGEVEVKTVEGDANEMADAAKELSCAWKRFHDYERAHPCAALDPEHALHWWKLCEYLMLANNRTKDVFLGRHRDPRSIRQHDAFRRQLLRGEAKLKADA